MADEKEIIIKVSADTGEAESGIQDLKGKLENINDTSVDKPFKTLKAQIKEANNEAQKMSSTYGEFSKQAVEANKRVAELKDTQSELNQRIASFNPDNKLASLVTIAKGATGAIQGLTGGMAFLGAESESANQIIAKLSGLMNFSSALDSIDDIKNGFSQFGTVIKDTVVKAFSSLKGAIFATGLGALLVAVGYVIANFEELSEKLGFASKAQKDLNKTQEDYSKGAEKAIADVNALKAAFSLAEKGTISKKEALKKYNDTLGDSLGKTNDYATAEKNMISKAGAYIEIQGLKAQATAKFALAAQYAAKALVAGNEDQTSWLEKAKGGILTYFGNAGAAMTSAIKAQVKGTNDAVNKLKGDADEINQSAISDLTKVEQLQKKFNVVGTPSKDGKTDDSAAKKKLEDAKRNAEELKKLQDDIHKNSLAASEKEILELEEKFNKEKALLVKNHQDTLQLEENFRNDLSAIILKNTELEVVKATEATGAKIQLDNSLRSTLINNADEGVKVHTAAEDAKVEWSKISNDEKEKLASNALGQVSDMLGKQTVAGKATAVAQTTIDTYTSATSAFKSLAGIPYVGPVLGGIAAAAAVASGLANVKRILAVKVPGKASGGGSAPSISAPSVSAPQINSTMLQGDLTKVQDVRVTNQSDQVIQAVISERELQKREDKKAFMDKLSSF